MKNILWISVLLGSFIVFGPKQTGRAQTLFEDVSAQVGIIDPWVRGESCAPAMGSGSAWGDYDNDGDVDLYLTNDTDPSFLYRNDGDTNGDGLPDFVDVATDLGVQMPEGMGHSALFIDFDNDGDQDLFLTIIEGNHLFRNSLAQTGVVSFEDIIGTSGIESFSRVITSAWGDYDKDGFLDLYMGNYRWCPGDDLSYDFLYHNNGDGTFTNVTDLLCVGDCPELNGLAFSAAWTDYDNDGDFDLYVANDLITTHGWPNVLWRNDGSDGAGGWIFTDVSVESGAGVGINSMGLGVGDYDNDGWLDYAMSNKGMNVLLHNNCDGTFTDLAIAAGVDRPETPEGEQAITWGTVFFDYNNDQWPDLYFVAGQIGGQLISQPNAFFQNNSDGTFTDISVASGLDDSLRGRSASIADFDNDGFVDVFVGRRNRPDAGGVIPYLLFRNLAGEQGNTNYWLSITVEGTISNRDGIGARLYLTTPDGLTQLREITTGPTYGGGDHRAAHFGLSSNMEASIRVQWPNGLVEDFGDFAADQEIHLVENTSIPCTDITYFRARCNSGNTLQARVALSNNLDHTGKTVRFDIDGTVYETEIISNTVHSRADLSVEVAPGNHTVALLSPVCFDPVETECAAGRQTAAEEMLWEEDDRTWEQGNPGTNVVPTETRLLGNYPNPFNPSTTIRYTIGRSSPVVVQVYSVLGQNVATLVNEFQQAGEYEVIWNGTNSNGFHVSSGIYMIRLNTDVTVNTKRMIFLK